MRLGQAAIFKLYCSSTAHYAISQPISWGLPHHAAAPRRSVAKSLQHRSLAISRSQPEQRQDDNIFSASASTTTEWGTHTLLQQLPPGSALQPLLQPLLQPSTSSSTSIPGDDVSPIATASTSLQTTGMPTVSATVDAPIDVAAADVSNNSPVLSIAASEASKQQQEQLVAAVAQQQAAPGNWIKVVACLSFAAMLCYLDRTNISTAIVPMAEQFGWNKQFCGAVLSAFFAGYGATQVLGGQLSDKYGGSAVLAGGLGVWSLATVLTPIAASLGTIPLLAARATLGMAQGLAFPAMHALLAKHVPSRVRSGAIGIIMACAHCGTALGFGASPAIIDALGWGWTYYLFGGAALLWLPFWLQMGKETSKQVAKVAVQAVQQVKQKAAATGAVAVAAASAGAHIMQSGANAGAALLARAAAGAPVTAAGAAVCCSGPVRSFADPMPAVRDAPVGVSRTAHPLLDAIEAQHLQQMQSCKLQQVAAGPSSNSIATGSSSSSSSSSGISSSSITSSSQNPNVGFWPLMRRKEVWAIAVAQYAAGWGFYGLLAWLPQFFIEHCGLQLSQLGGYTLAPYLLQAAVGAGAGIMADNLIVKRKWSIRDVRVLMQVAGMLGPAACLFAAASPISAHSPYLATGLITLGMGMSALTCSGVSASHLDIAPRHAGVVFGVGNTAGTMAGLVAVPGLGYVLQHTGSWSLAFGLAAAHNVVGAALWAKWVGDKPLPEDGGDPVAAVQPKQQHLPLQLAAAAPSATAEGLKLKAA